MNLAGKPIVNTFRRSLLLAVMSGALATACTKHQDAPATTSTGAAPAETNAQQQRRYKGKRIIKVQIHQAPPSFRIGYVRPAPSTT